jgi:hypothetical protein
VSIAVGYDATHENIAHLPKGAQAAGYSTGSAIIRWTPADWAAHPGAIRIDQDPAASDPTADVLDVENGAATVTDCPGWVIRATRGFHSAARPGQRWPAIYVNGSNIHPVANALAAAKLTGVGLWLASWGTAEAQAIAEVNSAGGPYPLIGIQFASGGFYDTDVWSAEWLAQVSTAGPYKHVTDGTQSLSAYAHARGMHAGTWLAEQQRLGGKATADALGSAIPKAGLPWYSNTP